MWTWTHTGNHYLEEHIVQCLIPTGESILNNPLVLQYWTLPHKNVPVLKWYTIESKKNIMSDCNECINMNGLHDKHGTNTSTVCRSLGWQRIEESFHTMKTVINNTGIPIDSNHLLILPTVPSSAEDS